MAKRKAITSGVRFDVLSRDRFTCQYCGASAPDVSLEIDHVTPVSRGGDNSRANLIAACHACNSGKKAKMIEYDKNLPFLELHESAPQNCSDIIGELRLVLCNQIRLCTCDEYAEFAYWLHLCLRYGLDDNRLREMSRYSICLGHMCEMLRDYFVTLKFDIEKETEINHRLLWPLCIVRHILLSKFTEINDRYLLARIHKSLTEGISAELLIEDAWTAQSFRDWLDTAENRIRTALGIPSIEDEDYCEEDVTDGPHTIS